MSLILSGTTGISGSAGVIDAETFAGQANTYYTDITARLGYTPLSNVNPSYSGTLTGGTGVINIGSGQFYKDSAGKVGIGTIAPLTSLNVNGTDGELIRISVTSDPGTVQEPALGFATGVTNTHPAVKISALEFDSSDSRASLLFYTRGENSDSAPSERVRITSAGNVGIGTTSPSQKLDVAGSILSSQSITIGTGGTYQAGSIYSDISWGMIFRAKQASPGGAEFRWANSLDAELMRINTTGYVGIGTNSPAGKLEVAGGRSWFTADSEVYSIGFRYSAATGVMYMGATNSVSTPSIQFSNSGGSSLATIDYSGNLSVIGKLSATTGINLALNTDINFNSGADNNSRIRVDSTTGTMDYYGFNGYRFYTTNGGNNERVRIDNAGNVGIGRTPHVNNKLEVTGTINARTAGTSGSTEVWAQAHDFWETPTYSGTAIQYYGSAVAGTAFGVPLANLGRLNFQNVSNVLIGVNGAVPIIFGTTSLERMRLTAAGDLGIGTTSPNAKLEIALVNAPGGAGFYGGANNLRLLAAAGSAFGEPAIKFQEAGTDVGAVIAGKNTANGSMDLIFGNRSSASTTSALTEKMRIVQDGNIRMGDAAAAVNTLRFFDIYNSDTGVNAGVIQRLITNNVAGTGNVTVDIVKYKNGSFTINNNETNAAAYTAFGIGGTERMRITSSGTVGIATTSSINNAILNVNGGINTTSGIVGYLTSDAFTLNGKTQPQYGANFSPTGSTPIGISGYYGISIATSGVECMRITSTGTIGIGTTTPEATLHVNGTGTGTNSYLGSFTTSNPSGVVVFVRNTSSTGWSSLRFHNDANTRVGSIGSGNSATSVLANMMYVSSQNGFPVVLSTGTGATPVERFRVTADGDVCVGTTALIGSSLFSLIAPSNRNGLVSRAGNNENYTFFGQNTGGTTTFFVTGAGLLSAASITETSSRDLKTNFRNVENSLEKVLKLTAYIYDRKDGSETDELGLIAEEVDPVINNLVMYDEEGKPVGVKYTRVGVLCLEAIKEIHKELMELKAQVNR